MRLIERMLKQNKVSFKKTLTSSIKTQNESDKNVKLKYQNEK